MTEDLPGVERIDGTFDRLGISRTAGAVLMILFGAMIVAFPDLIAWLVGGYLLIAGVVRLAGSI